MSVDKQDAPKQQRENIDINYVDNQKRTPRQIPVVILTPNP